MATLALDYQKGQLTGVTLYDPKDIEVRDSRASASRCVSLTFHDGEHKVRVYLESDLFEDLANQIDDVLAVTHGPAQVQTD